MKGVRDRVTCQCREAYHLRDDGDAGSEGVEVDLIGWQTIEGHLTFSEDAPQQRQGERALKGYQVSEAGNSI